MAKVAGGVMMVAEFMLSFGAVDSVIIAWLLGPVDAFVLLPMGRGLIGLGLVPR